MTCCVVRSCFFLCERSKHAPSRGDSNQVQNTRNCTSRHLSTAAFTLRCIVDDPHNKTASKAEYCIVSLQAVVRHPREAVPLRRFARSLNDLANSTLGRAARLHLARIPLPSLPLGSSQRISYAPPERPARHLLSFSEP